MKAAECAEPRAEPPSDKTKVNFCDYFVAAEIAAPPSGAEKVVVRNSPNIEDARSALDRLFAK